MTIRGCTAAELRERQQIRHQWRNSLARRLRLKLLAFVDCLIRFHVSTQMIQIARLYSVGRIESPIVYVTIEMCMSIQRGSLVRIAIRRSNAGRLSRDIAKTIIKTRRDLRESGAYFCIAVLFAVSFYPSLAVMHYHRHHSLDLSLPFAQKAYDVAFSSCAS